MTRARRRWWAAVIVLSAVLACLFGASISWSFLAVLVCCELLGLGSVVWPEDPA